MTTRANPPAGEQSGNKLGAHWRLVARPPALWLCVITHLIAPAPPVFAQAIVQEEPRLMLNTSVSTGYDGNVFVESMGVADPRYRDGGAHVGAGMDLSYSRRRDRVELSGTTGADFRGYRTADRFVAAAYHGSGGTSVRLSKRARVRASGTANYSPYFFVSRVPTIVSETEVRIDYRLIPRRLLSSHGIVALAYELSDHSSLEFDYAHTRSDFVGRELDLTTAGIGGRYRHAVTKHGWLRLGFRQDVGGYGRQLDAMVSRTIDVGLDFARGLPISRRTTFDFAFGTSALNDGVRTRYEPTGQAALTRQVSQNAAAKLEYKRSLSFIEGYREAYFSDTLVAAVLAQLSRATTLRAQVAYSNGRLGLLPGSSDVDSYSATARLQRRATDAVDLFFESSYYRYEFGRDAHIPGFPAGMNRAVVQAGIETSIPLLKERTSRATR